MVDYGKSIIYKLCCKDPTITDIYVGSTVNKNRRNQLHKHYCNNINDKKYNFYVYEFIRNHGNWDNWQFVVVENFPCENKIQLQTRERYWLETLNATLNKVIPTRTIKEYYKTNCEEILKKQKEKINCECGCIASKNYIARHRKSKKHLKLLNSQ
jgi:hypothetical protein